MGTQLNGKTYIQKIQTIAYSCLGIPLLFFIYLYLESSVDRLKEIIPSAYHLYVLLPTAIICLLLILWSMKKYRFFIDEAKTKPRLRDKLNLYQTANTYRFISYGTSALLISIGFFLTNAQPFAALFAIMIVLFSINNPNSRKIITELKLNKSEKEIILNGLDIP